MKSRSQLTDIADIVVAQMAETGKKQTDIYLELMMRERNVEITPANLDELKGIIQYSLSQRGRDDLLELTDE